MATTWKLRDFLHEKRIKPATLARQMGERMSRTAVYGLVQAEPPKAVYFDTFDALLPALKKLTGQDVTVGDLIEYQPDPEPLDTETEALMNTDLSGLGRFEPYDWGAEGPPEGKPVSYVAGKGLLVADEPA